MKTTIVVCDGDQTGQELLDEALRALDPTVIGCDLDSSDSTCPSPIASGPTTVLSTTPPPP